MSKNHGHGYIGRTPGDFKSVIARQVYQPTGVQTNFTFFANYDLGYIDAYQNGSRLTEVLDFTATDGSNIGLTTFAQNGDVVEFIAYKAFDIQNVFQALGNFTVNYDLTVGGSVSVGGSVTAVTYYGDGSNLTGIAVSEVGGISVDNFLRSDVDDTYEGVLTADAGARLMFPDSDANYSGIAVTSTAVIPEFNSHIFAGSDNAGITTDTANLNIFTRNGLGFGPTYSSGMIPRGELSHLFNLRNGNTTFQGNLYVGKSVTAVTYYGDGSNLTGINTVGGIDVSNFLRSDVDDTYDGVLTAGDAITARLKFPGGSGISGIAATTTLSESGHIFVGSDNAGSTTDTANLNIFTRNGFGFGPSISGQAVPKGELSHVFNLRNGNATFQGNLTVNDLNSNSDINLKKDIEVVTGATEVLNQLKGVKFTWKNTDEKSFGVIAQDVEKVLPELILEREDTGVKSVKYNGLIGILIEAVKELSAKVEELENKLEK